MQHAPSMIIMENNAAMNHKIIGVYLFIDTKKGLQIYENLISCSLTNIYMVGNEMHRLKVTENLLNKFDLHSLQFS